MSLDERCVYQVYTDRCDSPAIPGQAYCVQCVRRFVMEAKQEIARLERDLAQAEDHLNTWVRMLPERKR